MGFAQPVSDFLARPAPTLPVVVLGTGPSLDLYERSRHPGQYVIGLNEVVEHHDVDAVVYLDLACRELVVPDRVDLFRTELTRDSHDGRGWFFDRLQMPSDDWQGSYNHALWLLIHWGVRRIVVYGCDSVRGVPADTTATSITRRMARCDTELIPGAYAAIARVAKANERKFKLDINYVHLDCIANQ